LIRISINLQKGLAFKEEENKIIHFFTDIDFLFKYEGGFYSGGQIITNKR
jgi:hypothetical protein